MTQNFMDSKNKKPMKKIFVKEKEKWEKDLLRKTVQRAMKNVFFFYLSCSQWRIQESPRWMSFLFALSFLRFLITDNDRESRVPKYQFPVQPGPPTRSRESSAHDENIKKSSKDKKFLCCDEWIVESGSW